MGSVVDKVKLVQVYLQTLRVSPANYHSTYVAFFSVIRGWGPFEAPTTEIKLRLASSEPLTARVAVRKQIRSNPWFAETQTSVTKEPKCSRSLRGREYPTLWVT